MFARNCLTGSGASVANFWVSFGRFKTSLASESTSGLTMSLMLPWSTSSYKQRLAQGS